MKKLVLLIFLLASTTLFAREKYYIYVEKTGNYEADMVLSISVSLVNQFVTPVQPIPQTGINSEACAYGISLDSKKDELFLSFSSKNLNFFGKSSKSGPDAISQALLRGIFQVTSDGSIKQKICSSYNKLMKEESSALPQEQQQSMGFQEAEGQRPPPQRQRFDQERKRFPAPQRVQKFDGNRQGLRHFRRQQGDKPKHPQKLSRLVKEGQKVFQRGNYKKARKIFERATAMDPQDGMAFFGLAKTLGRLKQHQLAGRTYQQACDLRIRRACIAGRAYQRADHGQPRKPRPN